MADEGNTRKDDDLPTLFITGPAAVGVVAMCEYYRDLIDQAQQGQISSLSLPAIKGDLESSIGRLVLEDYMEKYLEAG